MLETRSRKRRKTTRGAPRRRTPCCSPLGAALLVAASVSALMGCTLSVGRSEQAIINGRTASASEVYGTVGIAFGDFSDPSLLSNCTGTLIRADVVLTAGHCVFRSDEFTGEPTRDLEPVGGLTVIAGSLDLSRSTADQRYQVTRIVAHPGYDNLTFGYDPVGPMTNDLALLFTDRPVSQVSVVATLPAARQSELTGGTPLTVTGYGTTFFAPDPFSGEEVAMGNGTLMIADVQLAASSAWEFFARNSSGADSCTGDSGGPVYRFDGATPVLVGVTSRGDPDALTQCGEGGIYTMPSAYEEWILLEAGPPPSTGCSVSRGGRAGGAPVPLGLALLFLVRRRAGSRKRRRISSTGRRPAP